MQLVSINVSMPIEVTHEGKQVVTGIFKKPVSGQVAVKRHNLEGDRQADLTVHGGESKAVYAYSLDHYAYWEQVLKRSDMPMGQFGENLTIAGLDETVSCIGDHLQIGSAVFAITQPRVPCFKLGIRFNDMEMPKRFSKAARTGFYLKILQEGSIAAPAEIRVLQAGLGNVSVKDLFLAYMNPQTSEAKGVLRRAAAIPELAEEWRQRILRRS
jgi:MOSC domain-containing protein YiiM